MTDLSSNAPKSVVLHGFLKNLQEEVPKFYANSAGEAIEAFSTQCKWLFEKKPLITVVVNGEVLDTESKLNASLPDGAEVHLVPALAGGKNPFKSILIGVALIALALYAPQLVIKKAGETIFSSAIALGAAGVGMVTMGLVQLLFPPPKPEEVVDSGTFGAPKNTVKIGTPITKAYGTVPLSGQVLSYSVNSSSFVSATFDGVYMTYHSGYSPPEGGGSGEPSGPTGLGNTTSRDIP